MGLMSIILLNHSNHGCGEQEEEGGGGGGGLDVLVILMSLLLYLSNIKGANFYSSYKL